MLFARRIGPHSQERYWADERGAADRVRAVFRRSAGECGLYSDAFDDQETVVRIYKGVVRWQYWGTPHEGYILKQGGESYPIAFVGADGAVRHRDFYSFHNRGDPRPTGLTQIGSGAYYLPVNLKDGTINRLPTDDRPYLINPISELTDPIPVPEVEAEIEAEIEVAAEPAFGAGGAVSTPDEEEEEDTTTTTTTVVREIIQIVIDDEDEEDDENEEEEEDEEKGGVDTYCIDTDRNLLTNSCCDAGVKKPNNLPTGSVEIRNERGYRGILVTCNVSDADGIVGSGTCGHERLSGGSSTRICFGHYSMPYKVWTNQLTPDRYRGFYTYTDGCGNKETVYSGDLTVPGRGQGSPKIKDYDQYAGSDQIGTLYVKTEGDGSKTVYYQAGRNNRSLASICHYD